MSGEWRFHTGDDSTWAQPGFDDSKWETITTEKRWGLQGHPGYTGFAWYRRAVDVDGVTGSVAVLMPYIKDAYEVYWNGRQIGGLGKLPPKAEWYPYPVSDVYEFPRGGDAGHLQGVLAIRVWKSMLTSDESEASGGLNRPPRVGATEILRDAVSADEVSLERVNLIWIVLSAIFLLVGLILAGAWAFDRRKRLELCLSIFLLSGSESAYVAFPALGRALDFEWSQILVLLLNCARDTSLWLFMLVLFGLYKERSWRRVTAILASIYLAADVVDLMAISFWRSDWQELRTIDMVATLVYSVLPAYLFVLLVAGLRRRREAALLPMALACAMLETYYLVTGGLAQTAVLTNMSMTSIFNTGGFSIGPYWVDTQLEFDIVVMVALVWTVYREQMRERRRQLFVESELKSAQEVQQVLVPEHTPEVPGFAISSLYWPAGEVGGDMFQVLPGDDGDLSIVLADVSGKGLKAAMAVSLMVGAVRTLAETSTNPTEILAGLNRRLMGRTSGGFSTCLVLHVTASGEVRMANAGHLPPFLNGNAVEMEGSLPLGISHEAEFPESRFRLGEGDELTLYTDGVVEAQKENGELFGFERAGELMRTRPSVQTIAEAAKAFGQQDDITVVRIVRSRSEEKQERVSVDLRTAASVAN